MFCEAHFNLPDEETEALLGGMTCPKTTAQIHRAGFQPRSESRARVSPFAQWGFLLWLVKLGARPHKRERQLSLGEACSEAEIPGYVIRRKGLC